MAYRNIAPQIMVEELLLGPDGQIPADYKLYVLQGRVRLVEIHTDRFSDHRVDLFLPDWRPVDARVSLSSRPGAPPRPDSLERMVDIAEALGRETDFVRVDLYDVAGRITFGELTSYPGGPAGPWGPYVPGASPEFLDIELGRQWTLPKHYR